MVSMDKLVSLCKRRGFIFPSSEIYGGLNGCWDYGPLGVELKRNIKAAWWDDMIGHHDQTTAPDGAPAAFDMVGLDCSILMNPAVWETHSLRPRSISRITAPLARTILCVMTSITCW